MTSTLTDKWLRLQDWLARDENLEVDYIERPVVREPKPETPLNFGGMRS